jgi:hypothetical protein
MRFLAVLDRCAVLRIAVLCFGSLCWSWIAVLGIAVLCSATLGCAWLRFALIGATYVGRALLDEKTSAG